MTPEPYYEIVDKLPIKRELRRTREGRAKLREHGIFDSQSYDASSKPFIGWDGEGITHGPDNITPQSYVLLAASTGDYIETEGQLTTRSCFDLMLRVKAENPHAIMVGFAFGYDSEMMIADLTAAQLDRLTKSTVKRVALAKITEPYKKGQYRVGEYRIEYIPRKWFQVSGCYEGKNVTCRIWDIWSFFGSSFLVALKSFLSVPEDDWRKIEHGKGERGQFTLEQLRSGMMLEYCQLELKYLVELMTRMRELLHRANLYPSQWHGPPAVADAVFKREGVKNHKAKCPDGVQDAAQYAFFGGRIENIKVGRAWQKCYKWDINSAYPTAMRMCPSLAGRDWILREISVEENHELMNVRFNQFGLYHVTLEIPAHELPDFPNPLPWRSKEGYVAFPYEVSGWYWGPEAKTTWENCNNIWPGSVTINAAWEIDTSEKPLSYPFAMWVTKIYKERLKYKSVGDPVQHALKICLNSAYGKMAQTAGFERSGRIPNWHQLEWAGFMTSFTRARVFQAALAAYRRGGLVAMETDAVVTTCDMPELRLGKGLGEWDKEELEDIIYLQSGVYFYKNETGWHSKYRGMDDGTISYEKTMDYLSNLDMTSHWSEFDELAMEGLTRTRFVSSRRALAQKFDLWRCWISDEVRLNIGASYKRVHLDATCKTCLMGKKWASEGLHVMATNSNLGGVSHAKRIPWRSISEDTWDWNEMKEDVHAHLFEE